MAKGMGGEQDPEQEREPLTYGALDDLREIGSVLADGASWLWDRVFGPRKP